MPGLTIEKTTIIEPNYTTWTYQRTIVSDVIPTSFNGIHVDENNNLLYYVADIGGVKLKVFDLNDGTTKFASVAGDYYGSAIPDKITIGFGNTTYASRSLNKYLCLFRADQSTIEVWSAPGTAVLWSRDITLDVPGARIGTILISQTGKYIIVSDDQIGFPNIYVYLGN